MVVGVHQRARMCATHTHTHARLKIQLWGIEELEWFNWFSKWPVCRDE